MQQKVKSLSDLFLCLTNKPHFYVHSGRNMDTREYGDIYIFSPPLRVTNVDDLPAIKRIKEKKKTKMPAINEWKEMYLNPLSFNLNFQF